MLFSKCGIFCVSVSISLVIMVFVNYGGGRYWFFRHESWNGKPSVVSLFSFFLAMLQFPHYLQIFAALLGICNVVDFKPGLPHFSSCRPYCC